MFPSTFHSEHNHSRFKKVSAFIRVPFFVLLVFGISFTPHDARVTHGFWLVLLMTLAWAGKLGPRRFLKKFLVLEPLVLAMAVMSLFAPDGLFRFATIVIKSTLCLSAVIIFSETTPFSDVLRVLKKWQVPSLLITTMSLTYRYFFLFVDELYRLRRAKQSRTMNSHNKLNWHALSQIITRLFIRTTQRVDKIYYAMSSRGGLF